MASSATLDIHCLARALSRALVAGASGGCKLSYPHLRLHLPLTLRRLPPPASSRLCGPQMSGFSLSAFTG